MHQMNSNQRIANLHYVLDELDKLYTAIQNGIHIEPQQTRKQLIESYQSQRSQFMDMLSFILPPISTPNASITTIPSITAASSSMFPSCIEQSGVGRNDDCDNDNDSSSNNNDNSTLNPESNEFVPSYTSIQPNQSVPSISSIHSMHSESNPINNQWQSITSPTNNNGWSVGAVGIQSVHEEDENNNTQSKVDTNSSYQSSLFENSNANNINNTNQYEYSDESDHAHYLTQNININNNDNDNDNDKDNNKDNNNNNEICQYDELVMNNGSKLKEKYDYDCDDDDDDINNNTFEDDNDPLLGSSPFVHNYNTNNTNTNNNNNNDLQLVIPSTIIMTPIVEDLDEETIELNKKKLFYENASNSKREKVIKSQIGHLLKFYKCGIDERIFLDAYSNYFGYSLELSYLAKCSNWHDFLHSCTWRKQHHNDHNDETQYVYTKYKSQYPHIYALKQVGNDMIGMLNNNNNNNKDNEDVLRLMDVMLESFECGIVKRHITQVFQLFYGKKLKCPSTTATDQHITRYFDRHCICANLYTFSGNIEAVDSIYISAKRLQKLKQNMLTQIRKELLQLFFYRSPSGILLSELSYVYRQKFKSNICLINISLLKFININMNEYIEWCNTSRGTLFYFRSYMGLPHTITKLLKSINLNLRCKWIRDKVTAILSLYRQGIEWKCLVKAVLSFGSFQLSQWLFTAPTQESPPSCIQLLQSVIEELHIQQTIVTENNTNQNKKKICILKQYLSSSKGKKKKKKKTFAPAIDCQDIYSYHDLVVNLLIEADKNTKSIQENKGLFIEQIESKFNQKYEKFRLIIETPLVLNQIRNRIDYQLFEECKRFKYDPYQFMACSKPKHWNHPYRNFNKKAQETHYTNINEYNTTKWRQKEKQKDLKEKSSPPQQLKQLKECKVTSTSTATSISTSTTSTRTVVKSFNDLQHNDICIIYGLKSGQSQESTQSNGVSVKLISYYSDKSKWKVMITTGNAVGDIEYISPLNLKGIDINTKEHNFSELNPIKADATKVGLINLSKSASRSQIIYKLEKSYGVKVLYCSDLIQDPYCLKSNFIAKLELQNCHQLGKIISAVQQETLQIDKQLIKFVMIIFALILAGSCLLVLQWHTIACLLIARLMSTFAITATRSEVNHIIGAYTQRRARSIGIIEMSFGLSALGYILVAIVLQQFGYKILFIGYCILITVIAICLYLLLDKKIKHKQTSPSSLYVQISELKKVLTHKRLQLIFISVLLNKIARNAFYYTLSKWLAVNYGFGPQNTGYMALCIVCGCLTGTSISKYFEIHNFMTGFLSAMIQVFSMVLEPIYHAFGQQTSIFSACLIIFFYFCGCQIWYNNILDIMIGVTPEPKLLPAVNTILLICGLFGGIIGTIGSTVWYEWGGHVAIATVCAAANVGVSCIVVLLWIAHRNHSLQSHVDTANNENENENITN